MTDKELEKMGIIAHKTKLNPIRYWCNTTQEYMKIRESDNIEGILTKIFQNGYTQGIDTGKRQRSAEIKGLLDCTDLF